MHNFTTFGVIELIFHLSNFFTFHGNECTKLMITNILKYLKTTYYGKLHQHKGDTLSLPKAMVTHSKNVREVLGEKSSFTKHGKSCIILQHAVFALVHLETVDTFEILIVNIFL